METAAAHSPDDPRLARLLEHPALWRGRSAAHSNIVPTGFAALDAALPGGGWPQVGLVEILISRLGIGELYLILPALASLTQRLEARWCAWIAPREPFAERGETGRRASRKSGASWASQASGASWASQASQASQASGVSGVGGVGGAGRARSSLEPFAPALAAHGLDLARVLVARTESSLWACEQALRSGACDAAVAWMQRVPVRALRRLQLAAERGRTLAFVFRGLSTRAACEPSAAVLRIAVRPERAGARIDILKSRGSPRRAICLAMHEKRDAEPRAAYAAAARAATRVAANAATAE